MKKRSNYKFIIIFCLVFLLSIGYAVVNSVTLTVTGTASSKSEEMDVVISSVNSISNSAKASTTINSNKKSATINVSDMTLNETITVSYDIRNNETDVGGILSVGEITNSNSKYYKVEVTWQNPNYDSICADETFFYPVMVKITMIKTPITEEDNSATFGVEIKATPSSVIVASNCK